MIVTIPFDNLAMVDGVNMESIYDSHPNCGWLVQSQAETARYRWLHGGELVRLRSEGNWRKVLSANKRDAGLELELGEPLYKS